LNNTNNNINNNTSTDKIVSETITNTKRRLNDSNKLLNIDNDTSIISNHIFEPNTFKNKTISSQTLNNFNTNNILSNESNIGIINAFNTNMNDQGHTSSISEENYEEAIKEYINSHGLPQDIKEKIIFFKKMITSYKRNKDDKNKLIKFLNKLSEITSENTNDIHVTKNI
jgi:hypothetical protein